jgi:hypothetical protein
MTAGKKDRRLHSSLASLVLLAVVMAPGVPMASAEPVQLQLGPVTLALDDADPAIITSEAWLAAASANLSAWRNTLFARTLQVRSSGIVGTTSRTQCP